MKMFNLINIGERSGSGIPNIFDIWEKNRLAPPTIREFLGPDRVTLLLLLGLEAKKATTKSDDKKATTKSDDKKTTIRTRQQQEEILSYLQNHDSCSTENVKELLNLKDTRARELLKGLIQDEKVIACGENKNRVYMLNDNKVEYK